MEDTQLKYWLALNEVPGIGGVRAQKLLQHISLPELFTATAATLQSLGLNPKQQKAFIRPNWDTIDDHLNWQAQGSNRYIISAEDERYPTQLKNIPTPPMLLYIEGDISTLNSPQIAMVGSRNPSFYGKRYAHSFAHSLVEKGITVTSGLALGIDSECHRSALDAGGQTLAVLGTGLANIYPKRHKKLAEEIIEKGALVSEFSPFTVAKPEHFPRRNRVVTGLSMGVVVIEAAIKSGSLISARFALEQGRDVFAVPGSIDNPMSAGCHYLIQQGAKLITEIADITDELNYLNVRTNFKQTSTPVSQGETVSLLNKLILDSVGYEVTTTDLITERSQQPAHQVLGALMELELEGWLSAVPGGYVRSERRD